MLLEIITLDLHDATRADLFERVFYRGQASLERLPGYFTHELQRSVHEPGHYVLLIEWQQQRPDAIHLSPLHGWDDLQSFLMAAPVTRCYELVAGRGIHTAPNASSEFLD